MKDLIPPHNIEVEQGILSSCLLYPDMASDSVDLLSPDDFYRTDHQRIFRTVSELVKSKTPVSLLSVQSAMPEKGMAHYLASLLDIPVVTDVRHFSEKLKEKRALRDLITECQKTISRCYGANGTGEDVIEECKRAISGVGVGAVGKTFTDMSDLTELSVERYEQLSKQKTQFGIMTGYPTLDKITGGLGGPLLVIIAARPSVGKTAFMCNLIANMAKAGTEIGVFELEMSKEALDNRWFAMLTGINSAKLKTGKGLGRDDWDSIVNAAGKKYDWQVMVDDSGGLTTEQIRRRAKAMVRAGAEIIFIDQLSQIRAGKGSGDYETNTNNVQELNFLKKELGIPIILLCQINRKVTDSADKKPQMHHLKSTGRIEEDADMVLLGHRASLYATTEEQRVALAHEASWDIAKHRDGPTWFIPMRWDGRTTRFYELTEG